tara:strand:- start:570 stop:1820 length:1251 start_codon:yes stop_codon:yes gene_type:complete
MRFYEVDSSVDAIMSAAMVAQTRASSMGKQGKLSMNGFLQMLANAGIMMDYDGFKTVFDTNPQLKNVIAQFNKDEITFVGDSDDEGVGYEEPQGDMPDDERVAKMAQRATKMRTEEFVEGYEVLPKMDREKYQERDGLEGPIMTRSGKVVYHDNKEGKYYDPDTDMYLSYDDYKMLDKKANEAELPPHLSKMFGKDGSQVETRTDVMKQMRDIVDNKSAMNVTFGDGKQMVDMYTASVLVQIYDKVKPENKEKIVQRIGTIEKFTKLMPKLFGMIGEGSSPHPKGSKKYKAHMAAKHANMNEVEDDLSDKIYAGIKAGMSKDEIISKYADKDNDPLLIDVMYSRIKFKMNEGKSVNEAWQAFNEAEEKSYTVVHAKHGKEVIKATSSYGAAKKYADMKKLKSTAGVDAHLMERDKT